MSEKYSTNIDDLPGPSFYEAPLNYSQNQNNRECNSIQSVQVDRLQDIADMTKGKGNLTHPGMPEYFNSPEHPNISHKIKKKEKFINDDKTKENDTLNFITNEFNTSNVLLFTIIYLSTLPISDEYTRKLLKLLPFDLIYSNSTTINIIKCFLLLIVFILIHKFFSI